MTSAVLFDVVTSTVSFGKIQLALADGTSIPEGWSIDGEGARHRRPGGRGRGGAMLPLGSSREQAPQGYGLALMVDVLCGVLPARPYGPHCLSLTSEFDQVADVGHFFAALRVDAFRPVEEFTATMDEMIRALRGSPAAPGADGVVVAGEPEFDEEQRRRSHGIPLTPDVWTQLEGFATELDLGDHLARLPITD